MILPDLWTTRSSLAGPVDREPPPPPRTRFSITEQSGGGGGTCKAQQHKNSHEILEPRKNKGGGGYPNAAQMFSCMVHRWPPIGANASFSRSCLHKLSSSILGHVGWNLDHLGINLDHQEEPPHKDLLLKTGGGGAKPPWRSPPYIVLSK